MFGATTSSLGAGFHPTEAVAALLVQVHNDLRDQHPEWIEANGESSLCDAYEVRLAELLDDYARTESDESAAAIHRVLEKQAHA